MACQTDTDSILQPYSPQVTKYPYSPVIEASIWRSKRLIKYVQLLRKRETIKSRFFCWSTSEQHTVCTRASATSVPYLWLRLHAGRRDVADLDERLWVVVIIVLLLWFVFIRDDHHRFYVFGERGCVQKVGWGLTGRQREGSLVKWYGVPYLKVITYSLCCHIPPLQRTQAHCCVIFDIQDGGRL